jgi:butyryl-CoA dehydrogenase
MDFTLDEEQALLRDMARDFAQNELVPRATRHDREARLDPEVLAKLAELGMLGLTVPEEHGGSALGNLALCLVLEELNRGCASTGVTVSVHNSLVCSPLAKYGTAEQKAAWLPRLARGEIDGTKIWVTTGSMAGVVIVYARTNPDVSKAKGISAFLVPADAPGFHVGKHEKKVGIRGSPAVELIFQNCRIPAANLLGQLDRGFPIALDTLDGGRIGIAAQAVGIGMACLEASIKYSKEREQFGEPIANFQAIQWKLADMATRLDAARLLAHRAAWLRDRGERCTQQAAEAKLAASTACNYAADECLQIHGGAGYTDDFHVERLFRDARITEIYEGATDIQRLVIARNLLA